MTDYIATSTDLTAVADAIREKGGTSAPLTWPQGYIDAVDDLSPAPAESVPSKDVDFYDYDGTRVYSYTAAEFAALTEMPANPDHSHDAVPLTAQGWNWTLEEAKAQITGAGYVAIGQFYDTTDSTNKMLVAVDKLKSIKINSYSNSQITVNWGDGTSDTYTVSGSVQPTHTYAAKGDYVITFSGGGCYIGLNATVSNGYHPEKSLPVHDYISGYTNQMQTRMLAYCYDLQTVTMRKSGTMGRYRGECFRACYNLRHVTLPYINTTTRVFETNFFRDDYALQSVCMPKDVWIVPDYTFYNCKALRKMFVPTTVESIGQYAFYECSSLESITLPSAITSIGTYAFYNCVSLKEIHMRPTTPPTLSSTNALSGIASDCVIYVPQGYLNTYKTASNWSSYASKMQEEPA